MCWHKTGDFSRAGWLLTNAACPCGRVTFCKFGWLNPSASNIQKCPATVPLQGVAQKSVQQKCRTRVPSKIIAQTCPARMSQKSAGHLLIAKRRHPNFNCKHESCNCEMTLAELTWLNMAELGLCQHGAVGGTLRLNLAGIEFSWILIRSKKLHSLEGSLQFPTLFLQLNVEGHNRDSPLNKSQLNEFRN